MFDRVFLGLALCAATPLFSHAAVINGNFETGNLSGWSSLGSAHVETAAFGVNPTEGTYDGYIETTGNFTALASAIVPFLGLTGSDIMALGQGAPTNGTGISQDITVSAGDTLTFDWNFLTDELDESATFNDFAFLTVDGSAFLLASRNTSTFNVVSPPVGFDGQTGWSSDSYNFASAGTFKIGFGVFNVGDSGHNSVLLLDIVNVPVPEPGTFVLMALALPVVFFRMRTR
jgi:hypothetical protein